MPKTPEALRQLPCIVDTNFQGQANWRFIEDGKTISVHVNGPVRVNSPLAAAQAAKLGLGVALLPSYLAEPMACGAGRWCSVLEDKLPAGQMLQAVYPHRRHLAGKVRALIDHLVDWFQSPSRALGGTTCSRPLSRSSLASLLAWPRRPSRIRTSSSMPRRRSSSTTRAGSPASGTSGRSTRRSRPGRSRGSTPTATAITSQRGDAGARRREPGRARRVSASTPMPARATETWHSPRGATRRSPTTNGRTTLRFDCRARPALRDRGHARDRGQRSRILRRDHLRRCVDGDAGECAGGLRAWRCEPPRDLTPELEEQLYRAAAGRQQLPPELAAAVRGTQGAHRRVAAAARGRARHRGRGGGSRGAVAEAAPPMPFGGPPPEPGFTLPRTGFLGWVAAAAGAISTPR